MKYSSANGKHTLSRTQRIHTTHVCVRHTFVFAESPKHHHQLQVWTINCHQPGSAPTLLYFFSVIQPPPLHSPIYGGFQFVRGQAAPISMLYKLTQSHSQTHTLPHSQNGSPGKGSRKKTCEVFVCSWHLLRTWLSLCHWFFMRFWRSFGALGGAPTVFSISILLSAGSEVPIISCATRTPHLTSSIFPATNVGSCGVPSAF